MGKKSDAVIPSPAGRQRAAIAISVGRNAGLTAEIELTSVGLLSIGALVSSILVSTALIVRLARRSDGREAGRVD